MEKKSNFIQDMKKRLNSYRLERIRKIEQNESYQQLMRQQNNAKDILIQIGDTSEVNFKQNLKNIEFSHVSGWANQNPIDLRVQSEKRPVSKTTNYITNNFIEKKKDLNMIQNFKEILLRLKTPATKRRDAVVSERNISFEDLGYNSLNSQSTLAQIRREKTNYQQEEYNSIKIPKLRSKINEPETKLMKITKSINKPERAKFQTIDFNLENQPILHSTRGQYKKINRNLQNQYDIDSTSNNEILHKLLNGTIQKGYKNNPILNRIQNSNKKFTLKNLLC